MGNLRFDNFSEQRGFKDLTGFLNNNVIVGSTGWVIY